MPLKLKLEPKRCKAIGCNSIVGSSSEFCVPCSEHISKQLQKAPALSIADKYPQYYKKTHGLTEIDVYAVHHLFDIQDPSGCIQHASKKLLLAGVRTGGKSPIKDITEARDTLNRWLELNQTL